jgi:hypothetical protein
VALDVDNTDKRLRTEMYAIGILSFPQGERLTLQASAVAGQGDSAYVLRVVDGKAVRTPVKAGVVGSGLVEVLKIQTADGWRDVTETDKFIEKNEAALEGQAVQVADR